MALKQRKDGKMWKDVFNFNFIVVISGILYLMLFVTCEPVCYARTSQDEPNSQVKMVDCDGSDDICMRFASREEVNVGQLLNSRCAYPEDYPAPHRKYTKVTCSTTKLPTVANGSFDCAPKSDVPKGKACNLTCKDGFYPAYSNQTVCEAGTSDQGKEWSQENFGCRAITCQKVDLPTVSAGFFNCSGNSIGDKCNFTCPDGYYPSLSKGTVCEKNNDNKANWTAGNFQCTANTCQEANLPTVIAGFFDCSGFSVGNKCNLTCDDGFYTSSSKETVCGENIDNKASWTAGNFQCTAITCQKIHLPSVTAGFFNCSGYSVGDKCNLTCDDGFYPYSSKETVCEAYDGHKANWTVGNFQCTAITCSTTNLTTVANGYFDCAPNSDIPQCEACSLTCSDGFYPPYSYQAVCEANPTNQGGVWSNGSFVCRRFECSEWNQRNGSEYKFISTRHTWDVSREMCKSSNSHHVTIENKEENKFVHKMLLHCSSSYYATWIGLNDRVTEGTWEWSDGTVSTYRNWGNRQPNDGDKGNCVNMAQAKGQWNDYSCYNGLHAVCETNNTLT